MSKQKKVLIMIMVLVVLLMGIGYAALTSKSITINGTASATANPDNFKVYFTGVNTVKNPELSEGVGATATVTTSIEGGNGVNEEGATQAAVTFSGLKKKDDTQYVVLEVKNGSLLNISAKSISAVVEQTAVTGTTVSTGITDPETINSYIQVSTERCNSDGSTFSGDSAVAKGNCAYIKVTATLVKETPVEDITNGFIVKVTATPEDPTV